jgi:hypothetical protein
MSTLKESRDASGTDRTARRLVPRKMEWTEIPLFIHGISPDRDPATGMKQYYQLLRRVKENLKEHPGKKLSDDEIFITWGVPTSPPQHEGTDQHLAEVERKIQEKVKNSMGSAYSNPFGLTGYVRDFLFYGITDLFYYISADGELALREHVFEHISKTISKLDKGVEDHFSLTIFGHSAGSVIAHDLLYHLFSEKKHGSEKGTGYREGMVTLREMVENRRLRVRRLYTFGSPISLLVLRAESLINRFRSGKLLNPEDIGLKGDVTLAGPRWVNFWTRHDLASYPVEFLYLNETGVIEDREISSSISPASAHTGYWTSDEMAEYIARTF